MRLFGIAFVLLMAFAPTRAHALDAEDAVAVLATAADPDARATAARILGASGDVAYEPALANALQHDATASVRAACASALGRLRGPNAQVHLLLAMRDASPIVHAAVAAALGTFDTFTHSCGSVYAAVWHPRYDLQICSDGAFHPQLRDRSPITSVRSRGGASP